MVKKKSSIGRNIILVLTIVLFVVGIILIGVQVAEYVNEYSSEEMELMGVSYGGVVSINIVEAPVESLE